MGNVMLGLALLVLIVLAFASLVVARFMRWVELPRADHFDKGSSEQQVYERLYGQRSSNVSSIHPHEDVARESHEDACGHEETHPRHRPSSGDQAHSARPRVRSGAI
jgi:hypothetical protein